MLWHKAQGAGGSGGSGGAVSTWDITTLTYIPPAATVFVGQGIFFKPDGLAAYTSDNGTDVIRQYTLTTAWDISTASFTQSFSISGQNRRPRNLYFKGDGLKMYVAGSGATGDEIIQYDLGTAWDISTASAVFQFNVVSQLTDPCGLHFKDDGLKMYVMPRANTPDVYEYDLATAWDVSTATFLQSASFTDQPAARSFYIRPDGLRCFITDNGLVFAYDLSTAWDITTKSSAVASYSYYNDISSLGENSFFRSDGFKFYVIGVGGSVYEWDMS